MKTTNNHSNYYKMILFMSILAFLNIGMAQTSFESTTLQYNYPNETTTVDENESISAKAFEAPKASVLYEMDQNPDYWVDYLESVLTEDITVKNEIENISSPVLLEMESDPLYWINYLKDETEEEESSSVINAMESDPYYWPHYLQRTVETDNI